MTVMPLLIIIAVILLIASIVFYSQLVSEKKKRIDVERINVRLKQENTLLETEQLKFQLQPHTLNNILANLKLIAKKLNKGMDSLSETLDYILYKGSKHLVSVEDEVHFVKKYLALNDLFISEIDAIKIDETEIKTACLYYANPCIPHLITAYFIENAFKHGNSNHPEFLTIKISLTENEFIFKVNNKIKKHGALPKEGGIGLSNMRRRLDILAKDRYEINFSCNESDYFSTLKIRFK